MKTGPSSSCVSSHRACWSTHHNPAVAAQPDVIVRRLTQQEAEWWQKEPAVLLSINIPWICCWCWLFLSAFHKSSWWQLWCFSSCVLLHGNRDHLFCFTLFINLCLLLIYSPLNMNVGECSPSSRGKNWGFLMLEMLSPLRFLCCAGSVKALVWGHSQPEGGVDLRSSGAFGRDRLWNLPGEAADISRERMRCSPPKDLPQGGSRCQSWTTWGPGTIQHKWRLSHRFLRRWRRTSAS